LLAARRIVRGSAWRFILFVSSGIAAMSDLAGGLCLLAFVLTILAVCGHGIWLVGAAIFNAIFGGSGGGHSGGKPQRCLKCGWLSVEQGHCTHCGDVPSSSLAQRSRNELQATARQLNRLQRSGQIPYDQCFALLKIIEADLSKLGGALPLEVWPTVSKLQDNTALPRKSEPFVIADETPPVESTVPQPEIVAANVQPAAANTAIDAYVIDETTAPPIVAQVNEPRIELATEQPAENPFAGKLAAFSQSHLQPSAPPQPITPSRTLADMLQGFMEESNIRWGEVFGGLLIVSCAIGLVVSLRATLEYIPYFPALLFMLFIVAFHGAGLYTLRRWKLAAVSRAILIIALLLVPLAFSAGVVLPGKGDSQRPLTDPMLITALVVGLGVFGWVAYSGSKELTGEGALRLTTAIIGCSLGQVVINRGAIDGLPREQMGLLALLPVAAFLIATIGQIWRAQAWRKMSGRRIEQTFMILGVSLFALIPPLALLVFKIEPRWQTFKELSPLLSLVATSVLTLGLVVHRRALTRSLAVLRTAGTSILLIGGALLIFLWVVAWPRPDLMLNVSLLTGALLLAIAIRTSIPALHAAAVSTLSVGIVIAFFWAAKLVSGTAPDSLQWLQASLQGRTSLLLTGLAAVIGGCGVWYFVKRDRRIGMAYIATAAVLSAFGLLIAGWSGFVPLAEPWTGDGDIAGPLFFCYAVALFAIAITIVSEQVLTAAMALLWIALIQLLSANETARSLLGSLHLLPERPVLVATILEAAVLAIMSLVLSRPSWRLTGTDFAAHLWRCGGHCGRDTVYRVGAAGQICRACAVCSAGGRCVGDCLHRATLARSTRRTASHADDNGRVCHCGRVGASDGGKGLDLVFTRSASAGPVASAGRIGPRVEHCSPPDETRHRLIRTARAEISARGSRVARRRRCVADNADRFLCVARDGLGTGRWCGTDHGNSDPLA
jgi:hypothetical protein